MKKIDELVGIIQGIDSDNTISGIEIEKLNEYSVLRVPLIRDRIPSVAQSVPLTY